jgi:hypothetical protein
LAADGEGVHDTTLTYWRRRPGRERRPEPDLHAVQTVIAQTGRSRARPAGRWTRPCWTTPSRRRTPVTQLIAAIRRVRREVPGAAQVVAQVTSAHDYDDPGKPRIAWNDKPARDALVDALVRDALAVLAALPGAGAWPAADAVGLLALIAGQDVELIDPTTRRSGRSAAVADRPAGRAGPGDQRRGP